MPLSPDTGMTLPTGVSAFLLECLDTDSTEDYNTGASESLSSCPSPETFRDDEGLGETSGFFFELFDAKKKIRELSTIERLVVSVVVMHQDRFLP